MAHQINVTTRWGGQRVGRMYHRGAMCAYVMRGGKVVWVRQPIGLPDVMMRLVTDVDAEWMEVGFLSKKQLTGNATDGWTDPGQYTRLKLQTTSDLITWLDGKFIDAPGGAVEDNGDGSYTYWSRSVLYKSWTQANATLHLPSERAGKSITALTIKRVEVALPRYPYAMPEDAAELQADLRSAGYAGARVEYVSAPLRVAVRLPQPGLAYAYQTTVDATGVTEVVTHTGLPISLPGYPYALPGGKDQLQTDLRAAGHGTAVVKLLGGQWEIILPDEYFESPNQRYLTGVIAPGDPYPYWDIYDNYQGEVEDNVLSGYYDQTTTTGGVVLVEQPRQFARLVIRRGARYE